MVVVSVVIPSYNSAKTIQACLDSVLNQKTKMKYEVIVVDSSDDRTPELLKKYPIKLIRRSKQTYPGTARNSGIKTAKGKIIACIDADCAAAPDWLEMLCAAHKQHDVVGGRILNGNPLSYFGWSLYFAEFSQYLSGGKKKIAQIPACNASYKASIFAKKRFSGSLTAEDMLFSAELPNLWYDGSVVVRHKNRESIDANIKRAVELGRGDVVLKSKTGKGAVIVRHPILVPGLLVYRFTKIAIRSIFSRYALAFLLTFPFVCIVLIAWYIGFLKASVRHTNL